ncbi:MAG: biotin/lipoyl-binding protein [Sedimentisphaerales bacterium]|nr:biotin/lipoyl-binding protein [Sedimentisphaerales bacterium]
MNNRLSTFTGLLVLLAGGAGVYILLRQRPSSEQEAEQVGQTVVPVQVAQIRQQTFHDAVQAYAIIPNPGVGGAAPASIPIASPVGGYISQVHCAVGQHVRLGEVLFCLYDEPARLTIEQAKQAVAFAEENLQRQEKLREIQGTSAAVYLEAQQLLKVARNQLQQAQAQHTLFEVKAPFDGTVTEMVAGLGQVVAQG